jgi:branched-chain amino acid transport system substrate-binding protein
MYASAGKTFGKICLTALSMALPMSQAMADNYSDGKIRLGVLTDLSGTFSDIAGMGSVEAVKMAAEDFGQVNGTPVEVISGDHQNKADIASGVAREWYDEKGVDAIFDLTNSSVALAVANISYEKNRIAIISGASSTRLTTDSCTPNSIQYVYDANSVSNVIGKSILKSGGDTWFFVTVDYAFGLSLEAAATKVVQAGNGKVVGSVKHPLGASDFSSPILQAQASGAKIIALANGGADTINAIKAAKEFSVTPAQNVVSMATTLTEVHGLGLENAQNLLFTEAFYWDMNDETREWARRYFERTKKMPNFYQAGMYSAALTYLKAAAATGTDEAGNVMKYIKATPINDVFTKNGHVRADGLHVHDMYLLQVKQPGESKYEWDYAKVVAKVAGEDAFSPMVAGACKYVK